MNGPRDEILQGVAEALADGMPVDWRGLAEADAALAGELESLRGVEEMASAFRALRESPGEEEAAAD